MQLVICQVAINILLHTLGSWILRASVVVAVLQRDLICLVQLSLLQPSLFGRAFDHNRRKGWKRTPSTKANELIGGICIQFYNYLLLPSWICSPDVAEHDYCPLLGSCAR